MIDFPKHRANLAKATPVPWGSKEYAIESVKRWFFEGKETDRPESIIIDIGDADEPFKEDLKLIIDLVNDSAELLDKAEKWDKVCDEVGIDETHPGAVNAISDLCADATIDIGEDLVKKKPKATAPVEEGKSRN